ncbi:hypothetical protein AC1031_010777 [Aphanomyces cochlioides]|nr:hypothetical protein AC1031_010777 [Aphanomyces cochlioides]
MVIIKTHDEKLYEAAKAGDIRRVRKYLLKKADPTWRNYDEAGLTSLMVAAGKGNAEAVILLAADADAHVLNFATEEGWTALMWAAMNGHADVVRALVDAGVDTSLADKTGRRARDWAASQRHVAISFMLDSVEASKRGRHAGELREALWMAAKNGNVATVRQLLNRGGEPNWAPPDEKGWTALIVACAKGHVTTVKTLLARGASVDIAASTGVTPLMCASAAGKIAIVKELLAHHADVNAINEDGGTALHGAAFYGHLAVVQVLANRGADLNMTDKTGRTAQDLAKRSQHDDIVTWLQEKEEGDLAEQQREQSQDRNLSYEASESRLFEAVKWGDVQMVEELLGDGSSVNWQDKFGRTALMEACIEGHTDVVQVLIAHDANVDLATVSGITALMCAASFGYLDVVDVLIDAGANVMLCDKRGYSARDWAELKQHNDLASVLEGAEGDVFKQERMAVLGNSDEDVDGHDLPNCSPGFQGSLDDATPLMQAALIGELTAVDNIVSHDPDSINLTNEHGMSALMLAAIEGNTDVAQLLLGRGAAVDLADKNGHTALMHTAYCGHADIIEVLVDGGADLTLRNKVGRTASDVALAVGHTALAKRLQYTNRIGRQSSLHIAMGVFTPRRSSMAMTILESKPSPISDTASCSELSPPSSPDESSIGGSLSKSISVSMKPSFTMDDPLASPWLPHETLNGLLQFKQEFLRGVLDSADKIMVPTTFIILPVHPKDPRASNVLVECIVAFLERFIHIVSCARDNSMSPWTQADPPFYLYLVDEATGDIVLGDYQVYPIQVDPSSPQDYAFLSTSWPLIQAGLRWLHDANTVVGMLATVGVPSLKVNALKTIEDHVAKIVVKTAETQLNVDAGRTFVDLLNEKDPSRTFAGLMPISMPSSGQTLWTQRSRSTALAP